MERDVRRAAGGRLPLDLVHGSAFGRLGDDEPKARDAVLGPEVDLDPAAGRAGRVPQRPDRAVDRRCRGPLRRSR